MLPHVHSPDPFGRIGNGPSPKKERNKESHNDHVEQRIEFKPHVEDDEPDVASPPMWKTSPPPITETSRQLELPCSSYCHYKSYHLLSPVSRSQLVARGQQELMDMIKDMPESSYELSLKDIVEQPLAQRLGQATAIEEKESNNNASSIGSKKRMSSSKNEYEKKKQFLRLGSMSNEPFLLSMLFPTSCGLKNKNNSKIGPCSMFSTRPRLNLREGKSNSIDKNQRKKGFSVAGGNENSNGSESKSSGGSNSINRRTCDLLPGCLSFIYAKAKAWDRKAAPFERDSM